jgi:hypothetical protein
VKYWEIIAGNLSKAGWSWAASQPWIPAGERSGLPTRIAATESGLSRTGDVKLTAFLELKRRFGLVANWLD